MNKVSIVVPVYNVELYLRECLESLINQSYEELEIVLVDDGSRDSSAKICDEYAKKDKRIRVIHQENAGAANAKNTGIDYATGEYLTFIDSDDYVDKEWILTMMNEIHNSKADMVECGLDLVYKNRIETIPEFNDCDTVFTTEEYIEQYLQRWTNSLFCNKLFRRKLTEDIRFRKERRCIDDEFYTYKVITRAEKIVRISEPLYHYRQRGTSAVKNQKNKLQITDDALEVLIERYEWVKRYYRKLRKIYLDHDMDFLLYFSRQGTYNEGLIKKYRKIARYYLRECFTMLPYKIILINWMHLLMCKPLINFGTSNYKSAEDRDDLFQ